jgi:hypothetical protein
MYNPKSKFNSLNGAHMSWLYGPESVPKILNLLNEINTQQSGTYNPWEAFLKGTESEIVLEESLKLHPRETTFFEFANSQFSLFDTVEATLNDRTGFTLEQIGLYPELDEQRVSAFFNELLEPLFEKGPWIKELFENLITQIVPLQIKKGYERRRSSGSYHSLRGVIFFHIPIEYNQEYLAEMRLDFLHELGHQVMFIYQLADSIIEHDEETMVYSGVREMNRTPYQALHAAVALTYMILTANMMLSDEQCVNEVKKLLSQEKNEMQIALRDTVSGLLTNCNPTSFGQLIFSDIEDVQS